MTITNDIRYIGVNDHEVDLFEGQYVVPNGMSYNSYAIMDEKIAIMDTVDQNFGKEWLANIEAVLDGRNPDYLIGQHVQSAMQVYQTKMPVIPVGYMLVESGSLTSVQYVSCTQPIPRAKNDIAVATALAGQYLGQQAIYLEGGSGAQLPVPLSMISAVKAHLSIPLIVGGGIKTPDAMADAFNAGADVVVIGNVLEENPALYTELFERLALL